MDKLVDCKRCGGNACYEQTVQDGLKTWMCMGCGFTTSDIMVENSEAHKALLETAPELYKDLLFVDDTKRVWSPSTVSLPAKGMVFIDGKTKRDWKWSAVKAIPLTEEEKQSGKFPADQTVKMDMVNSKLYDQKDFMDAMEEIGFFAVNEN